MLLRELTSKVLNKTVKEILDERKKKEGGIFLDESFQVGTLEESRWGQAEKSRFFKSQNCLESKSVFAWRTRSSFSSLSTNLMCSNL